MKKIAITAILLLASTSAFAASGATVTMSFETAGTGKTLYGDKTTASSSTALIGKASTGVGLAMKTSKAGYALATQHLNGSKTFASSYDSTSIYSSNATKGTPKITTLSNTDTTDFSGTGWDAM